MNTSLRGRFLVLDGPDGAGKSTMAAWLAQYLADHGVPSIKTAEPTRSVTGNLIRAMLQAEKERPDPVELALLFAADREAHLRLQIEPWLRAGLTVVCDRYWHSSVVYQGGAIVEAGDKTGHAWVRGVNRRFRRPDLSILLDLSPSLAEARLRARGGGDVFDRDRALLERCCLAYRHVEEHFQNDLIAHVDAAGDAEGVQGGILEALGRLG